MSFSVLFLPVGLLFINQDCNSYLPYLGIFHTVMTYLISSTASQDALKQRDMSGLSRLHPSDGQNTNSRQSVKDSTLGSCHAVEN
ncbi:hypothetical protein BKA61DRAFT_623841 [Leptodontidium sp. MPI-SDFR-AT-0119]|nr:hypothetical protein BKA61DRAFT_623841 [Leptodontidium sp. MPI-SDFR-AT-0119]